jgi:uncharacterized membrane protein (UPF0182 family)
MGITQVFFKPFIANLAVKAAMFALAATFLLVNFLTLVQTFKKQKFEVVGAPGQNKPHITKKHGVLAAMAVALFWTIVQPSAWEPVLLFLNSAPTGQVDPILGWDISFYLFQYPLLSQLSGAFISLLFFAVLPAIIAYWVGGNITIASKRHHFERKSLDFDRQARTHLSILLGLFLVWFAATRYLAMAGLLTSDSSALFGAGYTDVNVRLPLIRIQQIIALALGVLVLANIVLRRSAIVYAVPVVLISATIITGITGTIYQGFIVSPNEQARELPYIEYHIQATRQAYGLADIDQRVFPLERTAISRDALKGKEATIENIRLLDYRPLKEHYLQNQVHRLYYTFNDIDIDRYPL